MHGVYNWDLKYEGCVRVIAHADPAKAAIWRYHYLSSSRTPLQWHNLQLVGNREKRGMGAVGGYLTIPEGAKRDGKSYYVAVCDVGKEDSLNINFRDV